MTPAADIAGVIAALDRFGTKLHARDMSIGDEFAADVRLLGSLASEFIVGHDAVAAHFRAALALPVCFGLHWRERGASTHGDIGWLFADGEMVVAAGDNSETRTPYRLTGVLERRDGRWLWRQFHGSQPLADPRPIA